MIVYIYGYLSIFPNLRVDIPRKIIEEERLDHIWEIFDQKSSEISTHFPFFSCLCGNSLEYLSPERNSKIFLQKL